MQIWADQTVSSNVVTAMRFFKALALSLLIDGSAQAGDWKYSQRVQGSFDEVKDAIVMAIENRGLVVNDTSHIGDMLDRTGADIGSNRKLYDRAEIIEFCSARLSRQMMEADPHNIVLCPFALSIYALPGENGTWVAYRRPMGAAAAQLAELLQSSIAEAGY